MKKLSLVSFLIISLFVVSVSAHATGMRKEFRDYEISTVDDIFMSKKIQQVWTISYDSNELPVTVMKRKTLEGVEYVVHSKYFDVSYASTSDGFGAKEIRNSWRHVPKKISNAVLSGDEMKRQEVITPNKVTDETALGLIASYLPMLVNDDYTHLLN
ncbi:hypothetical protein GM418_26730 [Maribellus comscasis]|uniref:Uncharacterized protein n=1 Tax=Maribellus comscasis TaxID=2681766 RepID=A0A6I6K120_9BACT|nr:hypothetical protein [Maribellus comscasis]QGY47128.1 hypothetical protein GM418_26730 [Maribellus comscasis]